MTSEVCGDAFQVQKEPINAVRCPCYNALSLLLSKTSSLLQSLRNATGTMKEAIYFFIASAKRSSVFNNVLRIKLKSIFETRWVKGTKAKTLVATLCSSEFIVAVVCMSKGLATTVNLSKFSQKEVKAKLIAQNTITIEREKNHVCR